MCTTCGCEAAAHKPDHTHAHEHRRVRVEEDILARNNRHAVENRAYFQERGILAVNLMSSPGSGKTTLLERTLNDLQDSIPCAVIEGDQQTHRDADRIARTNVPVIQINTGAGCHLDAHGVQHALESLNPPDHSFLFIENVGNLVCPALFDLGEGTRVVILSVTEGDDKPLKYPLMFRSAQVMVVNKLDLLPHVDFDLDQCLDYARDVNSDLTVFALSARTGQGMEAWHGWLENHLPNKSPHPPFAKGGQGGIY